MPKILRCYKIAINVQLEVINSSLEVISQNKQLTNEKLSVSADEINQLLTFVKTNTETLLKEKIIANRALDEINKTISELNNAIEKEQNKGFSQNQIVLKVYAKKAINSDFDIAYLVNDASFKPTYDIYAKDVSSPMTLLYKADVYQNTGLNWDNVKLSLSSSNPTRNVTIPRIRPWYIDITSAIENYKKGTTFYGSIREGIDFSEKKTSIGRQENPFFFNAATVNPNGIDISYDLTLPYTIPSSKETETILIKEAPLTADYEFITFPRLNNNVFLEANIKNWQALNLLNGQMHIYFDNNYVGKGLIDTNLIDDGLKLSLGVDERIVVKREELKKAGSTGLFGGNTDRKFTYEITANNSKPEAISLKIIDQVPISQNEKIKVQNVVFNEAKYNEKSGELTWTVDLAPKESKKFEYSYNVNYPKDVEINGL